jgi:hypothetical protein
MKVAASAMKSEPELKEIADPTEIMWHGLLQVPPHFSPWAIAWIEQETLLIDRETRVWLALRNHALKVPSAAPLFLHELTAFEYDPLKIPALDSDEAKHLETHLSGWSRVLTGIVELP